MTSLRSTFGLDGGSGTERFGHVQRHFVAPMVLEADEAEKALEEFKWREAFQGDGNQVKTNMDDLTSILRRLPDGRKGSDKESERSAGFKCYLIFKISPPPTHPPTPPCRRPHPRLDRTTF